jgi:hypothetical protein
MKEPLVVLLEREKEIVGVGVGVDIVQKWQGL